MIIKDEESNTYTVELEYKTEKSVRTGFRTRQEARDYELGAAQPDRTCRRKSLAEQYNRSRSMISGIRMRPF